MAKKSISDLDKAIQQLKKQKEAILQSQKKADREHSTRQKIILGGWMLANDLAAVEKVKSSLVRSQDRAAFGLLPLDAEKTPVNP